MLLVTNNPKVLKDESPEFKGFERIQIDGDYGDVLVAVRDRVHKGHKLLTHPLSGSVKPDETPFKSIIISKELGQLDLESLSIIENSIEGYKKFLRDKSLEKNEKNWYDSSKQLLSDFSEIDYSLIKSAINNIS